MGRHDDERSKLDGQQQRADLKVAQQGERVRRLNGSAYKFPKEQELLDEMQQNAAAVSLNRALFDYAGEGEASAAKAPENDGDDTKGTC